MTPGEQALECVDAVAVQGPSWPWGSSPGPEIAEGLEPAVKADVVAKDFEVEGRENFFTLSSPSRGSTCSFDQCHWLWS